MKNVDLNVGGFIGAMIGVCIGGYVIAMNANPQTNNDRGIYQFGIGILIGCALAGNFIWSKLFSTRS